MLFSPVQVFLLKRLFFMGKVHSAKDLFNSCPCCSRRLLERLSQAFWNLKEFRVTLTLLTFPPRRKPIHNRGAVTSTIPQDLISHHEEHFLVLQLPPKHLVITLLWYKLVNIIFSDLCSPTKAFIPQASVQAHLHHRSNGTFPRPRFQLTFLSVHMHELVCMCVCHRMHVEARG